MGLIADIEVVNQKKLNHEKGYGKYTDLELGKQRIQNRRNGYGEIVDVEVVNQKYENEKNVSWYVRRSNATCYGWYVSVATDSLFLNCLPGLDNKYIDKTTNTPSYHLDNFLAIATAKSV